ncbi:MAG: hypothetical protein SYR96_07070 [Actinomycetota bacterium]|nr:hypothetical protein [Actinomycetota bacterium]
MRLDLPTDADAAVGAVLIGGSTWASLGGGSSRAGKGDEWRKV